MSRRKARHTKVDGFTRHRKRDTTVLRDTALRNIEVRKNLNTRNDRGSHLDVGGLHLVKSAVDAVTDLKVVFKRLDMNIRRAVDYALIKNEVYKADDRRGIRRRFDGRDIIGVGAHRIFIGHTLAERFDHVGYGIVGIAVILGDAVHNVLLAREDEPDLLRKRKEHFVGNARVDEVERGERNRHVVGRDRENIVHSSGRRGNRLGDLGLDRHRSEIDGLGVLVRRHAGQKIVFGDDLLVDHELADALRLGFREILKISGAVLVDVTVVDKYLENRVEHRLSSHFLFELLDHAVGILRLRDKFLVRDITVPVMVEKTRVERHHTELGARLKIGLDHVRLVVADTASDGVGRRHDLERGDTAVNLAVLVELRKENLRNYRLKTGGELGSHLLLLIRRERVDDTVDGLCRARRMKRTENEVARFSRGNRSTDRL